MNHSCKDVYHVWVKHLLNKDIMHLPSFLLNFFDLSCILDLLLCFCWKIFCFVVFFSVKHDIHVLSIKMFKWYFLLPDQVHNEARTYNHSEDHDISNVIMKWKTFIFLDNFGNIIYETNYSKDKQGVFSCFDLLEFPIRVVVNIFYLKSPNVYWIFASVFHSLILIIF